MLDNVEWLPEAPQPKNPIAVVAFEGWNDAAEASTGVLSYIAELHNGKTLARLDVEKYVNYDEIRPQIAFSGDKREITWPVTGFITVALPDHPHDLLLVLGDEPHRYWQQYCGQIETVLRQIGIKRVITLGAFLGQIPHTLPVQIFGHATEPDLTMNMNIHPSEYEGPVGITGVLHNHLAHSGMEAVSLWAGVPHYLAANPNPTIVRALLEKLGEAIGFQFQTTALDEEITSYEENIRQALEESLDFREYVSRLEEKTDHLTVTPHETRRFVEDVERFLQNPS